MHDHQGAKHQPPSDIRLRRRPWRQTAAPFGYLGDQGKSYPDWFTSDFKDPLTRTSLLGAIENSASSFPQIGRPIVVENQIVEESLSRKEDRLQ